MKSKPFLQWIGGKTQLLPTLFQMLPKEIEQMEYAEPFVGGVRCCLHFWAVIYG
jgi:DNA adenine methylase